jgi:V/A-type H+-transporting ATPase subunit C
VQSTNKGRIIAIGARSHVLYSRLLTADQYWTLLHLKSTGEIAVFLNDTAGYKNQLPVLINAQTHRIDLENAIRSVLIAEGKIILSALSGSRQAFFSNWLAIYEVNNLKNIFRWIRSRRLDRDTMRSRLFKVPDSKLPYDALLNCVDYKEALTTLNGTKYHDAIADKVEDLLKGRETSLFPLEQSLDNLFETELHESVAKLPSRDRKYLEPIFGARADLYNLAYLHRCMSYYNMIIEEVLSRTLPVKYLLTTKDLRAIAKGSDRDERVAVLGQKSKTYAEIFKNAYSSQDPELTLEINIKRHLYMQELAVFKKGTPSFHTAISYFMLKLHEIDDIIRIIEDVRYDYNRHTAVEFLIRPIISGGEASWQ